MPRRLAIALCFTVSTVIFGGRLMAAEEKYPRSELLVEISELAKPEVARQFVILDARERKQYDESRVPSAVWVDAAAWAKEFKDGRDADGWSNRIGKLGIGPEAKVIVYDNNSFNDAARIWWILRYWGVADVRLLQGNWMGWQSSSLPVEHGVSKSPSPARFVAKPHPERLATKQLILDSLKEGRLQIVDARSEGEFCGTDPRKNQRAGAIPGAKHLEWSDLIDKSNQRFKSPDQLRKLFADAGIDLEKPTATHCQSGGRASVTAFGMELMGAPRVSNYYASWGEWGNTEGTPIVIPKPAKK